MQKKIFALAVALSMVLSLASCGKSVGGDTAAADSTASTGDASAAASGSDTTEAAASTVNSDAVNVGFIYIGDDSQAYTANFIAAEKAIGTQFGDKVNCIAKYNVAEDSVESPLRELVDAGCGVIFTTSFGYGEVTKEVAAEYPDVQFYQATCANTSEDVPNYHTYMGEIYQGRYIAGVVAGMKLAQMVDAGTITAEQAKIGYVAAYPYAEVISGYTAFFLGIRSVVDTATMEVSYANTWGDYETEKQLANALLDDGCVVISQHSDTEGPANACEDAHTAGKEVYCVSYNQDMSDIAPNTCLISSRIDWDPFEVEAVQAYMDGTTLDADSWAGFDDGWVAMTDLNTAIAAEGTAEKITELEAAFADGSLKATDVFSGAYTGTDPYDESNTIDLSTGFEENATQSAPAFAYVLDDVITVLSTN